MKSYLYFLFQAMGQRSSTTTGAGGVGGTDDVILMADRIWGILLTDGSSYIKLAS